jgi:hypothetical protein
VEGPTFKPRGMEGERVGRRIRTRWLPRLVHWPDGLPGLDGSVDVSRLHESNVEWITDFRSGGRWGERSTSPRDGNGKP